MDRQQIATAMRNAAMAGDHESAKRLAGVYKSMGGSPPGLINPNPPEQSLLQAAKSVFQPPAQLPIRSPMEKEWWTENLPQSAANLPRNLAAGAGNMAYDAAKQFTDPIYNALSGRQSFGEAGMDLLHAPENALIPALKGMADFTLRPFGIDVETGRYSTEKLKEAWSDPAMAVAGVLPVLPKGTIPAAGRLAAKPVVGAAKGVAGAAGKVPVELTRKALKFTPSVKGKLQERVAKTVNEEGAYPGHKSLEKFQNTMWDQLTKVSDLIKPIAKRPVEVAADSWATPVLKKLETSAERSKDTKSALKYLEEFKADHPTLTLKDAQSVRRSINKKLRDYHKQKVNGVAPDSAGKSQMMEAIEKGLRGVVEANLPATKAINKRFHDMIVAEPFLEKATNKASNSSLTLGGREIAAGFIGQQAGGYPGMVAATVAAKVLRDPRVVGRAGKLLGTRGQLRAKAQRVMDAGEAARLIESIEPLLTELPQFKGEGNTLVDLQTPTFQRNQLNIDTREPVSRGRSQPAVDSIDRMFQIAQTMEGKLLLKEKLGKEAKWADLMDEILAVPTQLALPPSSRVNQLSLPPGASRQALPPGSTPPAALPPGAPVRPALPPGQGFSMSGDIIGQNAMAGLAAIRANGATFNSLGGKNMPNSTLGGITRSERVRLNNLSWGLTPANR